MIRRAIGIVGFVAIVGIGPIARADSALPVAATLTEGEHRYADLDYRGAATVCETAVRDPRATLVEQARGLACLGSAWLVLDQRRLARESFDLLFTIDPTHVIDDPGMSPRQRAFIEEIRAAHAPAVVVAKPEPTPVAKPEPAPVPAARRRPIYKRWYLWTPIAIGAVGLGVGLGLGLGLHAYAPRGTLPPGTVGLSLRF